MAYRRGDPLINFSFWFRLASCLVFYPVWCAAMIICKALYSVRFENRKSLMRYKGSAILVSNHTSLWDPVMVNGVVSPRLLYETMLEITVVTPFLGTFTRLLGGVPIPPGPRGMERLLETAPLAFKYRSFIHFYPEGECFTYNQEIKPFMPGAFYIAARLNVPVIPVVTVLEERKNGIFLARKYPKKNYIALEPVDAGRYIEKGEDGAITNASIKKFAEAVRVIMQNEIDRRRAENPRMGTMAYYKGQMPRISGIN